MQHLLSLTRGGGQLAETVQRRVQAKEALEDGGEQVCAAADELVLVEFEFDLGAAGERDAVFWSMAMAGESPSIESASPRSKRPKKRRA